MKKESNFKETFMKLWNNKRTHAAMVLGLWMIFLLFVMLIAFVGGESTQNTPINNQDVEEEKVEFVDYMLMQEYIRDKNYEYEYNITLGEGKVLYKGVKNGLHETGYKEDINETLKYQIDETGHYKVVLDELMAIDKLFVNINESLLDVDYLLDTLKDVSFMQEEKDGFRTFTYNLTLEEIDYTMVVTTDLENITNINIKFLNNIYDLNYDNIEHIEENSFNEEVN